MLVPHHYHFNQPFSFFPSANSPANNTTCSINLVRSICPLGLSFVNRPDDILSGRNRNFPQAKISREKLLPKFIRMFQNKIALIAEFGQWPTGVVTAFKPYLDRLSHVAFSNGMMLREEGFCLEGAHLSIKLNTLAQLKDGYRENMHLIKFFQHDHVLVIYNARITNLKPNHASYRDFEQWLTNLESDNPNNPVVFCDPWMGQHGMHGPITRGLLNALQARHEMRQGSEQFSPDEPFISVEDFTIPSFRANRNEYNPILRNQLKSLIRWILTLYDRLSHQENIDFTVAFANGDRNNRHVRAFNDRFFEFTEPLLADQDPMANTHVRP